MPFDSKIHELSFRARSLREESAFSWRYGQKQISRFARNDRKFRHLILLLLFAVSPLSLPAQTLRIAAASDLQFVYPISPRQYEKQSGVKLAITYGSSGNFFAQIQNGAPFDLFFSADVEYPKKLIDAGLADPRIALQSYAVGRSRSLASRQDSPLNPREGGLKTLLDSRIQKIAIANPEHAPYGRAAVAALQQARTLRAGQTKLVFGENISQAAQFVQSGSAQAGIDCPFACISPAMKWRQSGWDSTRNSVSTKSNRLRRARSPLPKKRPPASFLAFLKCHESPEHLSDMASLPRPISRW